MTLSATVTRTPHRPLVDWTPTAKAAGLLALALSTSLPTHGQDQGGTRPGFTVPTPSHNGGLPLYFEADKLEGATGDQTRASGSVRLKQGDMTLRADELVHTQSDNTAKATGNVKVLRQGNRFEGPQLRLALDTLEGEFVRPTYWFSRVKAGGRADLIEFHGSNHLVANRATYTSCTPENTLDPAQFDPAWELVTSKVDLNFETNEGRAENAVVWFKNVPILAAPVLTFPLNDQRKSGWLPPSFDVDNRSGFEFSIPYYWNIAPNYDATLTPTLAVRRGTGLDTEFRYLLPTDTGTVHTYALPDDQLTGKNRGMIDLRHTGKVNWNPSGQFITIYDLRWRRASDDDFWKDFPRNLPSTTPRLYDSHLNVEHQLNSRSWGLGASQNKLYANVQDWQTLKELDPEADATLSEVAAPYGRRRVGFNSRLSDSAGVAWHAQTELSQFTNPDPAKITGNRLHLTGSVDKMFGSPMGVMLQPRLSVNAASYDLNASPSTTAKRLSKVIPTFSLDSSAVFERPVHLFKQDLIQTLEPRIRYVRTPYVDQSDNPLFDSAPRSFNQYSMYNENAFTGVDRISDANQVTLGVNSRMLNPDNGAELMNVAVVQKVLFSDQRINPDGPEPITQRLSDIQLQGGTYVIPNWALDGALQLSAMKHRTERGVFGARYSPGPFKTIGLSYLYARNSSELVSLGWQWPIAGTSTSLTQMLKDALAASPGSSTEASGPGSSCGGTWYAVGRVNYSMLDKKVPNSLLGIEYDAGCWIGRVVSERVSVGRKTNSRIMFQLELVGLSRIGSSPLRALRENVPGYRLLREPNSLLSPQGSQPAFTDD